MLCSCLVWNERIYFYQVFCSEGHFAVSAGMSYSRNLKDKFQTQHEVCSVKAVPYGMTWKACQTFSPQPVSFRVSQDYVLWHNFLYLIVTGAAAERKWGERRGMTRNKKVAGIETATTTQRTAAIQLPRPPLRLTRRKWKEMRKDWWNIGVDLYAEMIEDDT